MEVSLDVYNFLGKKVKSLVNREMKNAGSHTISFNAGNLPSGNYFYQIKTPIGNYTRIMTLIK